MTLDISPVSLATRHHFAALLDAASAWQRARGAPGWTSPFDDGWMLPRIERGELFLAWPTGGQPCEAPVAAFRILWEDRPFWGDRERGDSIYLHSFAVRRDMAGLGVGTAVVEAVAGMGRERGRDKMRLDCFLPSHDLVAHYERHGFVSVGTTPMNGRMMNLMERPI